MSGHVTSALEFQEAAALVAPGQSNSTWEDVSGNTATSPRHEESRGSSGVWVIQLGRGLELFAGILNCWLLVSEEFARKGGVLAAPRGKGPFERARAMPA
jgi:hypothetical protein